MNNRSALFAQAIRGPVLLITVGALFALSQAHAVSFAHSWPILLIVVGLMKLFERSAAPQPPFIAPPPPPPIPHFGERPQ